MKLVVVAGAIAGAVALMNKRVRGTVAKTARAAGARAKSVARKAKK